MTALTVVLTLAVVAAVGALTAAAGIAAVCAWDRHNARRDEAQARRLYTGRWPR